MLKGGIGAGLDVRFATVTAATGRVAPAVAGLGTATPLRLTVAAAVRVAGVGNLGVMGRLGPLHILRPGGTHRDNIVQPFDDNPLDSTTASTTAWQKMFFTAVNFLLHPTANGRPFKFSCSTANLVYLTPISFHAIF